MPRAENAYRWFVVAHVIAYLSVVAASYSDMRYSGLPVTGVLLNVGILSLLFIPVAVILSIVIAMRRQNSKLMWMFWRIDIVVSLAQCAALVPGWF